MLFSPASNREAVDHRHFYLVLLILGSAVLTLSAKASNNRWRVINGMVARPHTYPSFVSLQRNGWHFCGGTLLNRDTVMTAAHCLFGDTASSLPALSVEAGVHDFNRKSGREVRSKLRSFHLHPKYTTYYHYYYTGDDIAILKLATPITETQWIRYVKLPDPDSARVGQASDIAGYGSIDTTKQVNPTILQEARLTIMSNDDCARTWNPVKNNNNFLCLSNNGKTLGVCYGDSGGPCYVTNARGEQVQVGITSYCSSPCSQPNFPNVFARVTTYLPWIRSFM